MRQRDMLQTENKMGVMPINRLLLSMSLPMVIFMLVQALYNIVDSIAELVSMAMSTFFLVRIHRKVIRHIGAAGERQTDP